MSRNIAIIVVYPDINHVAIGNNGGYLIVVTANDSTRLLICIVYFKFTPRKLAVILESMHHGISHIQFKFSHNTPHFQVCRPCWTSQHGGQFKSKRYLTFKVRMGVLDPANHHSANL